MTIMVFRKSTEGMFRMDRENPITGTGHMRVQVDQPKGDIHFYTGNGGGMLEICQQSYKASSRNPRRLGLHIQKRAATAEERVKNAVIVTNQEDTKKIIPKTKEISNAALTVETSRISVEMGRMEEKMRELASHSEQSMDMEQEFHKKQLTLNRAARFWPIFRMAVVIVAGIVQTVIAVRVMKSRHIF